MKALFSKRRILLDTSGSQTVNWSEYLNNLMSELKKRQCTLQEILISHWHPDHTEGVQHIFKTITKGNMTINKKDKIE